MVCFRELSEKELRKVVIAEAHNAKMFKSFLNAFEPIIFDVDYVELSMEVFSCSIKID